MPNFTNETTDEVTKTSPPLIPYVMVILMSIIGSLGNGWFIFVIPLTKSLNKSVYWLLFGVVIFDFVSSSFCIPFETIQNIIFIRYGILFGGPVCAVETPLFEIAISGSLIAQFLIAINRGMAVFKPIWYRSYSTNRSAVTILLIVAVFFPIIFIMSQYYWSFRPVQDTNSGDCELRIQYLFMQQIYDIVLVNIPIFVSIVIYIGIFARIIIATKAERLVAIKRARGSASMCLCMVLLAIIFCMYPLLNLLYIDTSGTTGVWLSSIYRSSFMINPIFYMFNGEFRRACISMFRTRILRKPLQAANENDTDG